MPSKANLTLKMSADSTQALGELKKLTGGLDAFSNKATKLGNVLKVGLGAAAATGLGLITKESLAAGQNLSNLTRLANAGAEEFQKYSAASRSLGIDSDKLADIFKDVSDKVGDFLQTGGGPLADFFENIAPKVGVTAKQFQNLSGPDALQLYVKSLERANVSQNEMTFFMEAIANDATKLIPLFSENNKLLNEQGDLADRLGTILSDVDITNLKNANIAVDNLQTGVVNLGTKLTASLAPAITEASNELIEFFATMISGEESLAALEKKAISLEASLFSGNRRGAQKKENAFIRKQLEGINEKIQIQKALGGDILVIDKETARVAKEILEVEGKIAELKGGGRPAAGKRKGFTRELEELKEYQERLKTIDTEVEDPTKKSVDTVEGGGLTEFEEKQAADKQAKDRRDDELKKERQIRNLEGLELFAMSEYEVLASSYSKRQEMLDEALNNELISKESHRKLNKKLNDKNLKDILKAGLFHNQRDLKFTDLTSKQKTKVVEHGLRNILGGMASHSKAAESLNKAFAIKDAITNTWLGVTQSLKAYPMPIAAGFAAAHLASGLSAVANIRSGGGGGSVGTPSTPSLTIPAIENLNNPDSIPQIESISAPLNERIEDERAVQKSVVIQIDGDGSLTREQLRELAEQVNELQESNVRINA